MAKTKKIGEMMIEEIREENLKRYERWAAKKPPFKVGEDVIFKGGKQGAVWGLKNGMRGVVVKVQPPIKPNPSSNLRALNRSNSLAGWSIEVRWKDGITNIYPAAWFQSASVLEKLSRV